MLEKPRDFHQNDKCIWVPALTFFFFFFFIQNSDIGTRLTSLYGSQTSSVVMSKHNSVLSPRIKRLYGFQPSRVVLCCKSATLAHELLVSVGPSPHLWFLHAKQRLLYEHTSLYGFQTSTVASCIHNSVISTRITSFYGFQPSSVVLYLQNSDLRTKLACLWVPDLTCDFLHAKQRA